MASFISGLEDIITMRAHVSLITSVLVRVWEIGMSNSAVGNMSLYYVIVIVIWQYLLKFKMYLPICPTFFFL